MALGSASSSPYRNRHHVRSRACRHRRGMGVSGPCTTIIPGMNTTPVSILEKLRLPDDDRAWEQFVQIYTPLLYYWTRQLGLQSHDAAELVQEVFLVLVEKLPEFQYDPAKSFRGWLRTILANKWKNRIRARGKLPMDQEASPSDVAVQPCTPEFEADEYRQYLVNRALELLRAEFPEVTWKICWEVIVGGKTPAQAAQEFHVTVNTVYLAKSRGLRRLREMLAGLLT
jgi:RNA polymerase sigma-70 factor (ECF subfamily)